MANVEGSKVAPEGRPKPAVVVVGAGFAGLRVARELAGEHVELTVVDRRSYHLFTPLLYQVATSSLSPGEVAVPVRSVLRGKHARCLMACVADIDLARQRITLDDAVQVPYDYLVIAAGAQSHYFGKERSWGAHVETLDDLFSAQKMRDRLLLSFEAAERELHPAARRGKLTFCVIGGGPSGVELAGAIADLGKRTLAEEYQQIGASDIRVMLFEAADRVLPNFSRESSERAREQLESLGVEVVLSCAVQRVEQGRLLIAGGWVECAMICWGGGVRAADLAKQVDSPKRHGRISVRPDCSLPGHANVFAIGDIAAFEQEDGTVLPGLAPVALQQGSFVARTISGEARGRARSRFRYVDRGMMATIGRWRAVAETRHARLSGRLAWFAWLALHVWQLIGFRSKLVVAIDWLWNYAGARRSSRLIEVERSPVDVHAIHRQQHPSKRLDYQPDG